MNVNDKGDLLGKILLVISFILLGFSFIVAITFPYLSIDEWFTLGMMKLPVVQEIYITAIDVHPPLYYLILKLGMTAFDLLNFSLDPIIVMEIVSIVPYIFILALAVTKIRKDYGWLSSGVFAFTLFAMSNFFTQYLNARMYSWGLLFTVLGFLCVKPVLEKNDLKSWLLLSVFALLGAYTHYFVAITFVSIYLLLFVFILIKHRDYIKNWFISTVVGIVFYCPWVFILIQQLDKVHSGYWVKKPTLESTLNCIGSILTSYQDFILSVVVLILFIAFFALIVKRWISSRDTEDEFLLIGVLTFILSVLIALVVSFVFKPILLIRYIVPLIAVVWVVFSIYISKIEIKRIVVPLVLILMIIGFVNIAVQMDEVNAEHIATEETLGILSDMNNNHTIVVYEGMQKYLRFSGFLDNATAFTCYKLNNTDHYPPYVSIIKLNNDTFDFKKDVKNNSDYDVYYIRDISNKMKSTHDYKAEKVHRVSNCIFTKLTPK